jgi:hypothetical protein
MTDHEMAIEIATRFIRAQAAIAALEAELAVREDYHPAIPWMEWVNQTLDSQKLGRGFQARLDTQLRAIQGASQEDLLCTLYSSITGA